MPDVSPVFPDQQAAVTEALTAIGMTPDYQPVNGETFISDLLSAKYPAAIFGLNTQRPWDFAQTRAHPGGTVEHLPRRRSDGRVAGQRGAGADR